MQHSSQLRRPANMRVPERCSLSEVEVNVQNNVPAQPSPPALVHRCQPPASWTTMQIRRQFIGRIRWRPMQRLIRWSKPTTCTADTVHRGSTTAYYVVMIACFVRRQHASALSWIADRAGRIAGLLLSQVGDVHNLFRACETLRGSCG